MDNIARNYYDTVNISFESALSMEAGLSYTENFPPNSAKKTRNWMELF